MIISIQFVKSVKGVKYYTDDLISVEISLYLCELLFSSSIDPCILILPMQSKSKSNAPPSTRSFCISSF